MPEELEKTTNGAAEPKKDPAKRAIEDRPPVVTPHSVTVNGKTLHYTASAGMMPMRCGQFRLCNRTPLSSVRTRKSPVMAMRL